MKKAAMLAILGAVAAGAAAVCAKVIRDRQNEAEDEYTECPCGCSEEGDGQEQNSLRHGQQFARGVVQISGFVCKCPALHQQHERAKQH